MKLRQRPDNGVWMVDFLCPATGARRRVSTGARVLAQAKQKVAAIMAGANEEPDKPKAEPKGPPGAYTLAHLFDHCLDTCWHSDAIKSNRATRSNIKVICERRIAWRGQTVRFGDLPLADITKEALDALVKAMRGQSYAPATIRRHLANVSKALTEAMDMTDERGQPRLLRKPKIPVIPGHRTREAVLEADEEAAFFDLIAKREADQPTLDWRRYAAQIRFLLYTGCRAGECCLLRVENVSQNAAGVWRVEFPAHATKSGKPRTVPLGPEIAATLPLLRELSADGRLFPFQPHSLWQRWKGLRDDLIAEGWDVARVNLHTLRHTCLTRLAKRWPLHKVSRWAGHSNVNITSLHYVHLNVDDLDDGLDILSAA